MRKKFEEFMFGLACVVLSVVMLSVGGGLCVGVVVVALTCVGGAVHFVIYNQITAGLLFIVISALSAGFLLANLVMPNGVFNRATSTF